MNRLRWAGWIAVSCALVAACDDGSSSGGGDADAQGDGAVDVPGALLDTGDEADGLAEDDATQEGGADEEVSPDLAPLVDELLTEEACGDDYEAPTTRTARGDDLRRLTLDAPEAVCNDGSPAILFVRAAGDAASANNWVFHLQGGGGCDGDYEACRLRWCGRDANDAGLMSSAFAADSMAGQGIFQRDADNRFGNANQVFVFYCSSDWWTGQQSDVVLADPEGASPDYRLHFRGHSIIEAALDALMAGAESDDGEEALPPLSDADLVMVTGSSAGSAGVTHNLDWIASRFDAGQTRVVGVMDSYFPPSFGLLEGETAAAIEAAFRDHWEVAFSERFGSFMDASCLAAHAGTDEEWTCATLDHLLLEHITTPYFAFMSLADPTIAGRWYIPAGMTMPEFARGVRGTLLLAPEIPDDAEEADAIDIAPGIYGPGCVQHVGLTGNPRFFEATVEDDGGDAWTFHDALGAWLDGQTLLAVDTLPPTRSVCATAAGGE